MKTYRPRRAGKRRLEGAPKGLLDVFRDPKTGRYTALYYEGYSFPPGEQPSFATCCVHGRDMSERPVSWHPQGVGMYFELSAYDAAGYRARVRRHRVRWADLPEPVRINILRDLAHA